MATTTTINSVTNLMSVADIGFIRPITLTLKCVNIRPNTMLYAWFDGVEVTRYITQTNPPGAPIKGGQIVSDSNGTVHAIFEIPGMMFTTGTKTLTLNEHPGASTATLDPNAPASNTAPDPVATYTVDLGEIKGAASADFVSTGVRQVFQRLTTTINTDIQTVNVSRPRPRDPLAETFFTHGVTDGVFITSIDLFFKSKDSNLPIWVEIRETLAGWPLETLVAPWASATMNASVVNISNDGSISTKFVFPKLVYLKPNANYCFVIQTRSNKYYAWTSKTGEVSKENGKIVFDQPYSGSLMKSENNFTWTAEQTEDVKFRLNKAHFNTGVGAVLKFPMIANSVYCSPETFYTVSGTTLVYASFTYKHGLDQISEIAISCAEAAWYNGLSGMDLNGTHLISSVISEYVVAFEIVDATTVATSSGWITTGTRVTAIKVDAPGNGYSTLSPVSVVITPTSPWSGVEATAEVVIVNNKIDHVIVTDAGSGYTTPPTITLTGGTGAGAVLTAIIEDKFTITTNRIYHEVNPSVSLFAPNSTEVNTSLKAVLGEFEDGGVTSYTDLAGDIPIKLNQYNKFDNNLLLVSRTNEIGLMPGGDNATVMTMTFNSTNPNVSPIIDLNASRMFFSSNQINNQFSSVRPREAIDSSLSSASVYTSDDVDVTIISGGFGYTSPPTVEFIGTGTGAVGTAILTGDAVTGVTITAGGSGYMYPPIMKFTGGGGSGANATCETTRFNSELHAKGGTARSRYFTKQQQISTPSTGMRVFVTAYSNIDSSFEVYIRTSLSSSGNKHTDQEWVQLNCDTTRNKSANVGKFVEYEFYEDDLVTFDIYTLKIVLRTKTPWQPPIIRDYRAIILAS